MKLSRIPISMPAMYMVNNLAATYLCIAYVSAALDKYRVIILNRKTKELITSHVESDTPTSLQYVNKYLVLTTTLGVVIFNEDGTDILHRIKNAVKESDQLTYIGAALLGDRIAIGTSTSIAFIQPETKEITTLNVKLQISCLGSLEDLLIIGDQSGIIHIYQGENRIKQHNLEHVALCIKTLKRKGLSAQIYVSDVIGRITVIDTRTFSIFAVINSHIKHISGFDIIKDCIVSASEDSFVNIWRVNEAPQLILSEKLKDVIITGLAVEENQIYVSSYDNNEITHLEHIQII